MLALAKRYSPSLILARFHTISPNSPGSVAVKLLHDRSLHLESDPWKRLAACSLVKALEWSTTFPEAVAKTQAGSTRALSSSSKSKGSRVVSDMARLIMQDASTACCASAVLYKVKARYRKRFCESLFELIPPAQTSRVCLLLDETAPDRAQQRVYGCSGMLVRR